MIGSWVLLPVENSEEAEVCRKDIAEPLKYFSWKILMTKISIDLIYAILRRKNEVKEQIPSCSKKSRSSGIGICYTRTKVMSYCL